MDITLQRILSLIPCKPDGKPVHGEAKKFAQSIGYDTGSMIAMWKNGASDSYKTKLYEISPKYNVSVEWLKGETDIKNPLPDVEDKKRKKVDSIMDRVKNLSDEDLELFAQMVEKMANN